MSNKDKNIIRTFKDWRRLNENTNDSINSESGDLLYNKFKSNFPEIEFGEFDIGIGISEDDLYIDIRVDEPEYSQFRHYAYDNRNIGGDLNKSGEGFVSKKNSMAVEFTSDYSDHIIFKWSGPVIKTNTELFNFIKDGATLSLDDIKNNPNWKLDQKNNIEPDISYEDFMSELNKNWEKQKGGHINYFKIVRKDNPRVSLNVSITIARSPNIKYDLSDIDNNNIVKSLKKIRDDEELELSSKSDYELRKLIDVALDAKDFDEVKRLSQYLKESNSYSIDNISHINIWNDDTGFYVYDIKSYSSALLEISRYNEY